MTKNEPSDELGSINEPNYQETARRELIVKRLARMHPESAAADALRAELEAMTGDGHGHEAN